jgi:hypothetical protein
VSQAKGERAEAESASDTDRPGAEYPIADTVPGEIEIAAQNAVEALGVITLLESGSTAGAAHAQLVRARTLLVPVAAMLCGFEMKASEG